MSTEWRFLVVEDKEDIAKQILDAVPNFVVEPDTAIAERRGNFADALKLLGREKFDILILDLKDDQRVGLDPEDVSAGMAVFDELKKTRFAPVVFYTAHPHKVRKLQTEFVRVVEKTEGVERLISEVKSVLDTRLPELSRHVENLQREYLWDFVSAHWKEFSGQHQKVDLAYLMAGRLASTLRLQAGEFAARAGGAPNAVPTGTNVHPMQMYVYPTVPQIQGGDLVAEDAENGSTLWLVLTPTCDFVQKKVEEVLLAKCVPLKDTLEYKNWIDSPDKPEELHALVGDNRKAAKGGPKKVQPERFKYLPGTFFVDDSVADFQALKTVPIDSLTSFRRVATLDSPFAEAVLARFTRYFARLGTPDIEKASVVGRLAAMLPAATAEALVKPPDGHPNSPTHGHLKLLHLN
jgi:DNA-binding response OmpR family regulator